MDRIARDKGVLFGKIHAAIPNCREERIQANDP